MGHRALVAYERPDRLYDLRHSHWGGADLELVDRLGERTPLAGGAVDPEVVADSVSRERILTDFLDPRRYEALYLVEVDGGVNPYRVAWLGWDGDDDRPAGRGAIVGVAPGENDREFRIWFRATKTVLGDLIESGRLGRREARPYLEKRVRSEYDAVRYAYCEK